MRFARVFGLLFGLNVVGLCLLFGVVRDSISTASRIAFVREDILGADKIFIMDVDGGRVRQLTDSQGNAYWPTWSPDGEWIAFAQYVDKQMEIFKVRTNGTGLTRLTSNLGTNTSPEWSPDGRWIAFTSIGERVAIYRMRPDGSAVQRVTPAKVEGAWSTWSPDSQWLVFRGVSGLEPRLYRIRADGTTLQPLVNDSAFLEYPAWSPDGGWIAATGGETPDIHLIPINGSEAIPLPIDFPYNILPTWSADGEWIVFAADDGIRNFDLYKMRLNGRDLQQLTDSVEHDKQPKWGPVIDLAWSGWWVGMIGVGIGVVTILISGKYPLLERFTDGFS